MRYSLRQLEVFLATARDENVSRAANALSMSQSAASGALKELESQFDVQLFDRIGKRLQLSELGMAVRPLAQQVLDHATALENTLAGNDVQGRLQVGATLTIGNYVAVNMIADFQNTFADADIALEVANTHSIANRVASYDLDVGLIEGEMHHPQLNIEHWRDDELTPFCHPDHPLAEKNALVDADLVQQKWILRESGSGTRQAFDRAMQGILPELQVAMELQHTEAIKRAVEAGLGVGCLSDICLSEAFARGSLVPLAVPSRDFRRAWYLITHRQKYHSTTLGHWLDLCRDRWSTSQ